MEKLESSKVCTITEPNNDEECKGLVDKTKDEICDTNSSFSQTGTSLVDGITPSKTVTTVDKHLEETTSSSSNDDQLGSSLDSEIGRIQVDAVHPLFMTKKRRVRKHSTGTSTEEDKTDLCYCEQCEAYFLKSIPNTVEHFVNIFHKPDDKCVYCDGPVYYYYYNNKRDVYHKCHKDHVESETYENNNNSISKS